LSGYEARGEVGEDGPGGMLEEVGEDGPGDTLEEATGGGAL